ncbi:sugar transferase [Pseudobacteriovorax antillogorgiicola]|uniref:Exopolysaccharide biosynthesis polyprenyl glycosylphosphotransferase n=1 Tax=Pseudobacteriovorax antillogorgiicola TaxID=1513793 RepID=A0A1Y6BPH5_9BACT|nr:sugar transferase [Pseudobacteriovorax antillogorgiicola]TCS54550.1 exopolysaccharide biosynthesis polyprenyl glycosylphosphotransferase [Pseudobacteriovorax antillogorgiicola]SMF18487.1 exopolysaccharide biosynthesis polyprenyl glycosylphosphotransferase [Pseudobacteriovorax antillogorgiicola]
MSKATSPLKTNFTADDQVELNPVFVKVYQDDRRGGIRSDDQEVIIGGFNPGALPERRYSTLSEGIKRAIDIAGALCAILLFSPFLILSALAVKLTSKGPLLFSQERVGQGGRIFKMYKFRTMVTNAEELKDSLMSKNESSGPVFKMTHDPRITKVGRVLRKFSFDELPQLFQVLSGDMSLVGPRPPIPKEVKKYKQWQTERLAVKPGITCIWQVSGRNQIGFEDWVRLDIKYIRNRTLFLDFLILAKTVKVVFISPDGK